jgi:hypothetical protein
MSLPHSYLLTANVMGHPYRVYTVRGLHLKGELMHGLCVLEKRMIFVRAGLSRFETAATLLHELFHAVYAEASLGNKSEEEVVEALSTVAAQLLRRNRSLRAKLLDGIPRRRVV